MHPDGKRVYVSAGGDGTVQVIDTATNTIIAAIPVGKRPWNMALTPDGRKLYVACGRSNAVAVVDTRSNTKIADVAGRRAAVGRRDSVMGNRGQRRISRIGRDTELGPETHFAHRTCAARQTHREMRLRPQFGVAKFVSDLIFGRAAALTLCLAPLAHAADNPAEVFELPSVDVVGTTPLPGLGTALRDVPANVQRFGATGIARAAAARR